MHRNRSDDSEFALIANRYGITSEEARRIVYSFFDILQLEARKLPFDNPTRIFSRDKFNELISVYQIPYIGRIGPVYSRYLLWRKNESRLIEQTDKESLKKESKSQKAERIAKALLSGKDCDIDIHPDVNYRRVWMVGKDGKRLARQIIPEKE